MASGTPLGNSNVHSIVSILLGRGGGGRLYSTNVPNIICSVVWQLLRWLLSSHTREYEENKVYTEVLLCSEGSLRSLKAK